MSRASFLIGPRMVVLALIARLSWPVLLHNPCVFTLLCLKLHGQGHIFKIKNQQCCACPRNLFKDALRGGQKRDEKKPCTWWDSNPPLCCHKACATTAVLQLLPQLSQLDNQPSFSLKLCLTLVNYLFVNQFVYFSKKQDVANLVRWKKLFDQDSFPELS